MAQEAKAAAEISLEKDRSSPHAAVPFLRDLIVIGGSAGSFETVRAIAQAFPAEFIGSVFIVLHIGQHRSILPELLARGSKLTSSHARTGEPVRPGHIYVAPPDQHILLEDGKIILSRGPREHFTRPAIDPLFRSAARAYRSRVIGVVLSGAGSDGAAGLDAIQRAGGLVVVQDLSDAAFREMPEAAASIAKPDHILRAVEIPALLLRLSAEVISAEAVRTSEETDNMGDLERPFTLSCPDCGGALRPIPNSQFLQYRCHIGHRVAAPEMVPAQMETLEKAINVAIRVLNEQAELARQMIENARGAPYKVAYWQRLQAEAEEQAGTLRHFLDQRPPIDNHAESVPE